MGDRGDTQETKTLHERNLVDYEVGKFQVERDDAFITEWAPCPVCGRVHDDVFVYPIYQHPHDDKWGWVGICPKTEYAVSVAIKREDGSFV